MKFSLGNVNAMWIVSLCLSLSILDLSSPAVSNLPCYGCTQYYGDRRRPLKRQTKGAGDCGNVCPICPLLRCEDGVSELLDGCGCCHMCARQHGDLCSRRQVCDIRKGLWCDVPRRMTNGLCRASNPKTCRVNGVTYKDGDQFHLDCRRLCTCQNGNYGCADLCPQDHKPPTAEYCKNAKLVAVPGQCCHQWTCNGQNYTNKSPRHAEWKISSNSMMNYPPEEYKKDIQSNQPECIEGNLDWSACSVTCGVGVSHRHEPNSCGKIKEIRVCYVRPCMDEPLWSLGKKRRCTPTTRVNEKEHIIYKEGNKECKSVKKYRLKFCTTCNKNKCCYPHRTQTRDLEFFCESHYKYIKYSWIKRCRCSKQCRQQKLHNKDKTKLRRH